MEKSRVINNSTALISSSSSSSSSNKRARPTVSKVCPCCGEIKSIRTETIGINAMRLAVALNGRFLNVFQANKQAINDYVTKFKVCYNCLRRTNQALDIARFLFPDEFNCVVTFSKTSVLFDGPKFEVAGENKDEDAITLYEAFLSLIDSNDEESKKSMIKLDNLKSIPSFNVLPRWKKGDEVKVIARLGPNENHPASDAIVQKVSIDGKYDVKYDVWHVLKGKSIKAIEHNLPETLLTNRDVATNETRTTRAQASNDALNVNPQQVATLMAELAKERHRADILQDQVNTRDARLSRLHAQQKQMKALLKEDEREIEKLKSQSEHQQLVLIAQRESSNRQLLDIINEMETDKEEVVAAARADGLKEGKDSQKQKVRIVEAKNKRLSSEVILKTVEVENMQVSMRDMLSEAADQAAAEAKEAVTKEQSEKWKEAEMNLNMVVVDLEQTKKRHKLNQALLVDSNARNAALAQQFEEQRRALEEELESQLAQLLQFQKVNDNASIDSKKTFSEIAAFFLPPQVYKIYCDRQNLDSLGKKVKSRFCDLKPGSKLQRTIGQMVTAIMNEVFEASLANFDAEDKDYVTLLKVVKELRTTKGSPIGAAVDGLEAEVSKSCIDHDGLAKSYIALRRTNNKAGAVSILSILVSNPALKDKEVMSMCSELVIKVGDRVKVNMGRNKNKEFIAVEVTDEKVTVRPPLPPDAMDTSDSTSDFSVLRAKVSCVGAVRTTKHQLRKAKLHALKHFPGAKVNPSMRNPIRMSSSRASFVAKFLTRADVSTSVEASYVNAGKGVKYLLRQNYAATYRRLVLEMLDNELKPVSWGYFYNKTHINKEFSVETADNCCCAHCRDLGFYNFDELNDILKELNQRLKELSEELEKDEFNTKKLRDTRTQEFDEINRKLLSRVKSQKEFLSGAYQTHLKATDGNGWHCLQCLLTTSNNPEFRKPCTHGRSDGKVIQHQLTMEEEWTAAGNRGKPKEAFWNGICEFCDGKGRHMFCKYCNTVAHHDCAVLVCDDIPDNVPGENNWICVACTSVNDSEQHSTDCEECNEFGYIISDIENLIDLLDYFESQNEELDKKSICGPVLRARLDTVEQKQNQYRAHKIRHFNQDGFKELCLKNMELNQCYMLVDYWAKLKSQDASTALCEGEEVGISTHGSMFVYKNPTLAEREELSSQFPDIDWTKFPSSPDDGGDEFLTDFFNAFCDNSKQTSFHTASTINAAIKLFGVSRPWLVVDRNVFIQSDGAVNYRDPTTEIDINFISCRCITEAGEGKDRIDSNCAIVKRLLCQARNRSQGKAHQRNASDYVRDANQKVVPGNVNFVVAVDGKLEEKVSEEKKRKPVNGISGLYLWEVDDEAEVITFWEALDREASDCTPFKPVGYGPGRKMRLEEFNEKHRTRSDQMGASIADEDTLQPNTIMLKSKEEKKAALEEKTKDKEAKKAKRESVKQEKEAVKMSMEKELVFECGNDGCSYMCMTEHSLKVHQNGPCAAAIQLRKKARDSQDLNGLMSELDKDQVVARDEAIAKLAYVKVILTPSRSREIGIGFKKNTDNRLVVHEVVEGGLAFFGMQVSEGFVLHQVDGEDFKVIDDDLYEEGDRYDELIFFKGQTPLELLFHRAEAPLPMHGFARKNVRKIPQFKLHERQTEWLEKYWTFHKTSGVRAEQMSEAMKEEFGNEVREDINAPFWLDRVRIRGWISGSKQVAKDKKKINDYLEDVEKKKKKAALKKDIPPASGATKPLAKKAKSSSGSSSGSRKREAPPEAVDDGALDGGYESSVNSDDDYGDSSSDEE